MIDSSRRIVLTTAAAAAAATTAPQVLAHAPQAGTSPGLPVGARVGFYEKDNVRIRFTEIGSGFPLLATPGGGLNSRIGRDRGVSLEGAGGAEGSHHQPRTHVP